MTTNQINDDALLDARDIAEEMEQAHADYETEIVKEPTMTEELLLNERAQLIAESRNIDYETALELVTLRDSLQIPELEKGIIRVTGKHVGYLHYSFHCEDDQEAGEVFGQYLSRAVNNFDELRSTVKAALNRITDNDMMTVYGMEPLRQRLENVLLLTSEEHAVLNRKESDR